MQCGGAVDMAVCACAATNPNPCPENAVFSGGGCNHSSREMSCPIMKVEGG